MSQIQNLIDSMYGNQAQQGLAKTAEDHFAEALGSSTQEDALRGMSTEQLIKLAQDAGLEVSAPAETPESLQADAIEQWIEEQESRIAAHATAHEMTLAKIAMVNGYCRVCKENRLAGDGYTICVSCRS